MTHKNILGTTLYTVGLKLKNTTAPIGLPAKKVKIEQVRKLRKSDESSPFIKYRFSFHIQERCSRG